MATIKLLKRGFAAKNNMTAVQAAKI